MNPQATHRETDSSELTTSSMQPVMSPPTPANFQKAYLLDFFRRSEIFDIALPRTYLLTAPVNETKLGRRQYTARNQSTRDKTHEEGVCFGDKDRCLLSFHEK